MKARIKPPTKKLKTSASRASNRQVDDEYYEEESSMRLSRAFVVVLILHVVAVGGILLFNSMKARHEVTSPTAYIAEKPESGPSAASQQAMESAQAGAPAETGRVHVMTVNDTLNKLAGEYGVTVGEIIAANGIKTQADIRVGQRLVIPPRGAAAPVPRLAEVRQVATNPPAAQAAAPASELATAATAATVVEPLPASGTYTVVKGDNPVAIARKFGVSYQDLLSINNIDDPKLLQIGQVLKLPEKK